MKKAIPHLQNRSWKDYSGLSHAFFGRKGGASTEPFDSLNVSYAVGDDPKSLSSNWCNAKIVLGAHKHRVSAMEQVHGTRIIEVTEETGKVAGECDALVTRTPGCFLAIQTADCVPIFIIEPEQKIAAAIHAGWRGSVAGIVTQVVEYLEENYDVDANQLQACIGPCIQECCYTVGEDVAEVVHRDWPNVDLTLDVLISRDDQFYLNLRELNCQQLHQAGIGADDAFFVGPCTACHTGTYFSHRAENGSTGRQLSLIGWTS